MLNMWVLCMWGVSYQKQGVCQVLIISTKTPQSSTSLRGFCECSIKDFLSLFLNRGLVAEGKASKQALVELVVRALGIIEHLTAASHHHEQATA